ncbi:MAG: hypothetical protein ABFQ82_04780 [Thermodesulfobacteriota bacterium]
MTTEQQPFENKLIPVMREGVEVIKMIFFKKLGDVLAEKQPEREAKSRAMLTGAIVNTIFATPNTQEPFASFNEENRELIAREVGNVAAQLEEMQIPLTDALRMQALCDKMEELDDSKVLQLARDNGILIEERDMPMPNSFIDLVRRMGKAFGLLIPPLPEDDPATDTTQ